MQHTTAKELHQLHKTGGNTERNTLRSICRAIINEVATPDLKDKYRTAAGCTLAQSIDRWNRYVHAYIIAMYLQEKSNNNGRWFYHNDLEWVFLASATAMKDDSLCHKGSRGVMQGYHVGFPSMAEIDDAIKQMADDLDDDDTIDRPFNEVWRNRQIGHELLGSVHDVTKSLLNMDEGQLWQEICDLGMQGLCGDEDGMEAMSEWLRNCDEWCDPKPLDHWDEFYHRVIRDCSKIVVEKLTPRKSAPDPQPAKAAMVTVDPNLKQGVDTMLSAATNGAVTDISVLITAQSQVATLEEQVAELQAAAAQPKFSKSGQSVVDGSTLTYEVVMRSAADIFKDPDGKKSKKMMFDVPTLVWRDDKGNEVRHPDCPDIDEGYQFRMYMLIKCLSAVVMGDNQWLHGHTGTGKTTFIEQVAARMGYPIERLNLDSSLERSDVVGGTEIEVSDGSPVTRYVEGILPRAMQQPYWFIMDECDAGRADMLFVVQRALEGKGITITEDAGRTVQQHELFRFFATANSRGQGDEFGFYAGVRPMNIAFMNRFGMFIEVPYLDKDDEMRLLKHSYPSLSNTEVTEFAEFARKVRHAFLNGEISQTMSPRNLNSMARYYCHFKTLMSDKDAKREAVAVAVIDAAPADNRHTIERLFENLTA